MMEESTTSPAFETSRRGFLRTTAVAATGTAFGTLTQRLGAYVAGSDVIRIGMVGCGPRCAGAALNAMNVDAGVRLVAMCDIFLDRVHSKRKQLEAQKPDQVQVDDDHCFTGFGGYREVIESVDVVLIACAAKFHPLHLSAAIEAGKHVFVEKPHAIDPVGVRVVEAALERAREKNLCVVSGLHSRFDPVYREGILRIHDGAIGDVVTIEENFLRGPYGLYARKPEHTELQYQCSNQYHFSWLSGDDVPQSLIHNVDRSIWAMGEATPVRCHGLGGRSSMTDEIYGDVFDHHAVIYEFENGVKLYAFCRTTTGCYDEVSSLIRGTKGTCELLKGRIRGETTWDHRGRRANAYDEEHRALFRAIRAGETLISGTHMVESTRATVMGQMSCYTGREMTREEMLTSTFHHPPRPEECTDDMQPPVRPGPHGSYPVPVPGQTKLA